MNPESGRGNGDGQRSTESRIQSGLEAIGHCGRMKLDDIFEVTGSLTNTIREEGSYLPVSKYTFGNIAHVEGCSRALPIWKYASYCSRALEGSTENTRSHCRHSSLTRYQNLFEPSSP
jgi:hypothetical protein